MKRKRTGINVDDLEAWRARQDAGVALVRDTATGEPKLVDVHGRGRSNEQMQSDVAEMAVYRSANS